MSEQLAPVDEQLLRDTVHKVFGELFGSSVVRRLMATQTGWDPATWRRLVGELGVAGIAVDETFGGSGLSTREAGLVFEEAGRCLGATPLFAVTGLAIPLLQAAGDAAACARWLPGLCDGTVIATVAYADARGRFGPDRVDVRAEGDRLFGTAGYVVDGAIADVLFTPARTADGTAIFAVERDAPGVAVAQLVTLDQTRKQADVTLDGARGVRLSCSGSTGYALEQAYATSCALLACELAGVAAQCLDMAAEYARSRVQFGRPIGSFQAVKQKLAELLIRVESARSASAAAVAAAGTADLWWTASLAKAYCSEAAMRAAEDAIQLHGGIGFTWEHDAHLYFKRARAGEEMLGTAREHYGRVGEYLGRI
jgi:acyl-CoA dehydrogenase